MSFQELKLDAEELRKLVEQATRPKVKDILSLALRKLETEIINKEEAEKKEESGEAKKEEVKKAATSTTQRKYTKDITTYAWDQSDKFMKIYVTLPGVHNINKENVTSEFTKSSFRVRAEDVGGVNYSCAVGYLWEDIEPSASYIKIKTDTILVMLRKVKEKTTWAYVTQKDTKAKEKEKKPDPDLDKGDPQDSLMNLMKKMYDDGDDEMKRTIAKAWTESHEKRVQGGADDL